jgi:hypothetical protein
MTQSSIALALFSLFATLNSRSQDNTTLHGTVLDYETKDFLVGASIRISGTTIGTQSDISGRFRLNVPNKSVFDSLIVTYVGYKKYGESILRLKDKGNLQISLISRATNLKEVIVRSDFWRKQYSTAQLREDYTKFYTIMEKVHTGLFDYLSEKEWQALKDSSFQLFSHPMSHSEFYRLIALHVGRVRNMHTRHGVTDWWYRQKQNIFPFNVRYFDDKLYVSESLMKELDFPKGCQIVSINGRTPREIKDMIWLFIPADGFNETGKLASLDDYFPWYFSLFVEEATQYDIKLKKLNGDEITITPPGLRDSFSHLSFQQVWKRKKSALELEIDRDLKTAYFRIEDSRVFKDSIQDYFKRIRSNGIQYLIIDLRGEGGIREGEHVAELYSYLVNKPFQAYKSLEVKSNDWSLFDKDFTYKPYARSLTEIKTEFFDKLIPSGNGSYLWQGEALKKLNQPANDNFTGTVFILADGRNYSASTSFTSLASQLDNVFVIGEETGGEYRSYVSGAMFGLVLPNSKIGIKIATWKSTLAIEENPANRGRGVMPDYPVSISLDDFTRGTDVVKEFVFELISKRKQQK